MIFKRFLNFIRRVSFLGVGIFLLLSVSLTHAGVYDEDRTGGSDHPIISRYAGSILYMYGEENYGVARTLVSNKGQLLEQTAEGKISNKVYWGPKGHDALAIFRNYQTALRDAGFEILYQCETVQCDKDRTQTKIVRWAQAAHWNDNGSNDYYIIRMFEYKPGFHYIYARKIGSAGTVSVQIALRSGDESDKYSQGRVQQFIQIIETAPIAQGMVSIDASTIGASIKREGKIALYGILFDTNKAVIKSASNPTLEQMAKLLRDEPALKVFIVGHTDNQGSVEENLALSRKRADAVVQILNTQYGIAADRLQSQGVANFAPVSNNLNDEGRTKNRRVEMVAR
ncbi:OOP family OmpA-OmpF porin [Undibacterium sp. GrIS 1.2]